MIEVIVQIELLILIVLPFVTLGSTYFLARLLVGAVQPPVLLTLLVVNAAVTLLTASYFAALAVDARLFNTADSQLLAVTLLAIIAQLSMINVIVFVLRGYRIRIPVPNAAALKAAKETAESAKETSKIADAAVDKVAGKVDDES